MILAVIVALYFSVMVPGQEWPVVAGPYATWEQCDEVRAFLDRQGYATDRCGTMPYPQISAQYLEVGTYPVLDIEGELDNEE